MEKSLFVEKTAATVEEKGNVNLVTSGLVALEMTPLVVKNSSTNLIPRREQADTESMKNMRNCENKRWQT